MADTLAEIHMGVALRLGLRRSEWGDVPTPIPPSEFSMLCEDQEDMLCEDNEPMVTEDEP